MLTNAFPAGRSSQAIGMAYGIAGLVNAAGPLYAFTTVAVQAVVRLERAGEAARCLVALL